MPVAQPFFCKKIGVKKIYIPILLLPFTAIAQEPKKDTARILESVTVETKQVTHTGKASISSLDLPQAVSVLGEKMIREQQAQRLSDVLKNVNGVYLATTRGATQENFSARGYGLGANNLFKDGSRINSGAMPEMSGLEKVEVLKGAAAILYGNVAPGAIVNLVSKRPKFEQGGEINLRAGSYGMFKPAVDFYGPVNKHIAYRINGTFETADSYRDQVQSKRYYVNPSLLLKLNARTDVLLQADFLRHKFTPDFGVGSIDNTKITPVGRNVFFGTSWQYAKTRQSSASVTVNHRLQNNWKLNSAISYQHYDRDYFSVERMQAAANGDMPRPLGRSFNEENYFTAQVNFSGRWKQHQLLIGADADKYQTVAFIYNQPAIYDTINVLDPNKFTAKTAMPAADRIRKTETPTYRFGAYVQDLIHISAKLKLLAGIRWSVQEAKPVITTDLITKTLTKGTIKTDRAFSPRFGLVYRATTHTSLFASYANTFSVNSGTDVYGNALTPSIIDQYEIGIKNELLKGRLSLNATAYKIINNNLAQTALFAADGVTPNNNTNLKALTGQTTSDGIELDVVSHFPDGLDVTAGYSYNYIRYTRTPEAKANFVEGERLQNSVGSTANMTAFYSCKKFRFGAGAYFTGKRFAGFNNTKGQVQNYNRLFEVDGYATMDVSAAYNAKKFSVTAKVSNLTNVLNYYLHENYSINPIPPRQVIATVSYKL